MLVMAPGSFYCLSLDHDHAFMQQLDTCTAAEQWAGLQIASEKSLKLSDDATGRRCLVAKGSFFKRGSPFLSHYPHSVSLPVQKAWQDPRHDVSASLFIAA